MRHIKAAINLGYIEGLTKELVKALEESIRDIEEADYSLFSSPNRAKFKRLRVELAKHLVKVERKLYQ